MPEDAEEGGIRLWHLVKATDEPEGAKVRRSSLRERERTRVKTIPEIYLTRLLSMKVGMASAACQPQDGRGGGRDGHDLGRGRAPASNTPCPRTHGPRLLPHRARCRSLWMTHSRPSLA